MAGGVGPSSPFVASGEGPSLPFISGGVGPHSPLVHGGVGPSSPFMPGTVGPSSSFGLGLSFTVSGAGGSSSCMDGAAGARCFSWVEVLGARRIVRGWWWCALVSPFLGGGGGAPSWVFVCHVVLSPFEGEGGGLSFVFAGAPSVVVVIGIVLHRFCVLSSHVILVACPQHCMSLSSLCVLAMSLSHALLVLVPYCCRCHALIVTCHLVARHGTCVRNIGRGR